MNSIQSASAAQNDASQPDKSTWVSANAGSGKTRVLTDRVARLLLSGCEPQKILCLTFTKAAAAEMQNRLFRNLGQWAMMPDAELRNMLEGLGERDFNDEHMRKARTLFARALETPGGLKIQTIHSFCSSILRRFPLEAGVSPQFQEMEDRQSKQLRAEIIEEIATDAGAAFDAMARHTTNEEIDKLLQDALKLRGRFAEGFNEEKVAKALGTEAGLTDDHILAGVMLGVSSNDIDRLANAMAQGSKTDQGHAVNLSSSLKQRATGALDLYREVFLISTGAPRKGNFPTKQVKDVNPWVPDMLDIIKERMVIARDHRLARDAIDRARALHGFMAEFFDRYDQRKSALGRLDFDDLIQKTVTLLSQSNMAAWVLYKLDGGIDHILVDEAQDTSPTQWQIVRILAEEFYTGEENRKTPRTVFVVGDEKQSIYSFQGADPSAFGAMRGFFARRLSDVGQELQQMELLFSFRSCAPVLDLVDKVFSGDAREGLEGDISHLTVHADMPGRVELWPFIEKGEKPEENPWYVPVDSTTPDAPHLILANEIAARVAGLISSHYILPAKSRPVCAGDFLILVQTRNKLFHAIIKALKSNGVDVAGADRLKIVEELAVKDLLALLQFLATPEDDLSLAAVLRSPIFCFSEGDIYTLAHARKGTLWQSLWSHRERWPEAVEMLEDLSAQADFLRPYDLLERVLIKYDARRNLTARLGMEAEDGIDELLTQSLRYESVEAPSLTGFLAWISSDDVEVKRQMDAAGNRVRVMTVHGAKGLESPIVILPDTTKRPEGRHAPQVVALDGLALWKTSAGNAPSRLVQAEQDRQQLVREETRRLLYVALTRAENWLIVCGAGELDKGGDSWFQRVETAMRDSGAEEVAAVDGLTGTALRLAHNWRDDHGKSDGIIPKSSDFPDALWANVPPPPRSVKTISPSNLSGDHTLTGGDPDLEATALERGNHIHNLLENLAALPRSDRAAKAQQLTDSDDLPDLLAEVEAVLDAEALSFVFAENTLVEVPVTAQIDALDGRIMGRIDRLVIADDEVTAIDFKSNRQIPETPDQTPSAILRQMGAYADALRQIYPDKRVKTAIIWTARAELMWLDKKITATALSSNNPP